MTFPAYISRYSDRNGGFSRSVTVEMPNEISGDYTAIRHAAQILSEVESGVPAMQGRTFHVSACEIEHDPRRVDTGWKAFDAQANRSGGFICGNVDSDVQNSNFVRSYRNVACNGFAFPAGQLRNDDLARFSRSQFREARFDAVREKLGAGDLLSQELVVYLISHLDSAGMRKFHGWIVTKPEGELVLTHQVATSLRSLVVLDRAKEAFTMATVAGSETPLLKIDAGVVTMVDSEVRALVDDLVVAESDGRQTPRPRG